MMEDQATFVPNEVVDIVSEDLNEEIQLGTAINSILGCFTPHSREKTITEFSFPPTEDNNISIASDSIVAPSFHDFPAYDGIDLDNVPIIFTDQPTSNISNSADENNYIAAPIEGNVPTQHIENADYIEFANAEIIGNIQPSYNIPSGEDIDMAIYDTDGSLLL